MHPQLFPTLVTPWTVYSLPGSTVHGIFQARILEWVVISSSGDLPKPGIEPTLLASAGRFFTTVPPGKPNCRRKVLYNDRFILSVILCKRIASLTMRFGSGVNF